MPGKDKTQKEEENKGLFSKFRKSKKKSEQVMTQHGADEKRPVAEGGFVDFALPLVDDMHFFVCLESVVLSAS